MSIFFFRSREELPSGCYLTDCAVSGGRLEDFLSAALSAAHGRLCVRICPVYMEFPLPCFNGTGRVLSRQEALSRPGSDRLHISGDLCTGYFTYWEHNRLRLVLFDTQETLEKKLRCCQAAKVPYVLLEGWKAE